MPKEIPNSMPTVEQQPYSSSIFIYIIFLVAPTLGSLLPLLEHRAEFPQFLDQGQSAGLLGRVISSSQFVT
jgi:hypothetical protein